MAELGLITGGDHLKFCNSVLIELRRCAARQFVFIRKAIDKKTRVVSALAENGRGVVTVEISLTVDGDAWNQLKQVQIIPAVDGHVADILRKNRRTRGRRIRLEQRQIGGDFYDFIDSTAFKKNVERQRAVQRHVQILEGACGKPGVRNAERVKTGGEILKSIGPGR